MENSPLKTQPDRQADPVQDAHDKYRAAFAAHAADPTPSNANKRDAAQNEYKYQNANRSGTTEAANHYARATGRMYSK